MNVSASDIAETYDSHQQIIHDNDHENTSTNTNDDIMYQLRFTICLEIMGVNNFTSNNYECEYDHTTSTNIH